MRDGTPHDTADLTVATAALTYDMDTGLFLYARPIAKGWSIAPGTTAGTCTPSGYCRIRVGGRFVMAHRLAWAFFWGEYPRGFIDHLNGDRLDNRICNLRVVTKRVNAQNRKRANRNNRCGYLGVYFRQRQGWTASIGTPEGHRLVGFFNSPEAAYIAYVAAKRQLHEGNTL